MTTELTANEWAGHVACDRASGFTCGSIIEDGRRIVGLSISRQDRPWKLGDYEGIGYSTKLVCFLMQEVPDDGPMPGNALKTNNEIVAAEVFLQTVLDNAWQLGFRPSPEHAAATREESLARAAQVDADYAARDSIPPSADEAKTGPMAVTDGGGKAPFTPQAQGEQATAGCAQAPQSGNANCGITVGPSASTASMGTALGQQAGARRLDLHGFTLLEVPVQQPASMCNAMVREDKLVETLQRAGYVVTKERG